MKPTEKWTRKPNGYMRIGASNGCKSTGSKQRGIDYHRRVYRALNHHFLSLSADYSLSIEPWYREQGTGRHRSPDAVLIHKPTATGLVIEVKLNWKDGRDIKLIDEYLGIVRQAEGLEACWPLLITKCLRGYPHPPILKIEDWHKAQAWQVGSPTPLMLLL